MNMTSQPAVPQSATLLERSSMASSHSQAILQNLWNHCKVLRDDGLPYGDYVEQLDCHAPPAM